jgi:hypothetical protein
MVKNDHNFNYQKNSLHIFKHGLEIVSNCAILLKRNQ